MFHSAEIHSADLLHPKLRATSPGVYAKRNTCSCGMAKRRPTVLFEHLRRFSRAFRLLWRHCGRPTEIVRRDDSIRRETRQVRMKSYMVACVGEPADGDRRVRSSTCRSCRNEPNATSRPQCRVHLQPGAEDPEDALASCSQRLFPTSIIARFDRAIQGARVLWRGA